MSSLTIRCASSSDLDQIWAIVKPVIRAGETYALPLDMSRTDALDYWMNASSEVFVALDEQNIVGTYKLGPNRPAQGSHIANCSYMTHENARGKGVARAMCTHSLAQAKASGFTAIQFNFVVANNPHAIELWTSMGFETLCTLPRVFHHPGDGMVDALVMFKTLD